MTTSDTFGERVKQARKDRGISVEKLRDRVRETIPARYVPGVKTFYRIESGEVDETAVDGILVVAIAHVLDVRISRLSPAVADEHERLGDLLASSLRWITTLTESEDGDHPVTPCDGQLDLLPELALAS
jgi:transcriptional regulator with XRE-family HTH domain